MLGHVVRTVSTQRGLYIASVVFLLAVYLGGKWLTGFKLGKVQRAIRDSDNRVLFSGYAAANYKLFIFVVACVVAGLAGALYVPQVGIIKSLNISVACAVSLYEAYRQKNNAGHYDAPKLGSQQLNELRDEWGFIEEG